MDPTSKRGKGGQKEKRAKKGEKSKRRSERQIKNRGRKGKRLEIAHPLVSA